MTTTFGRVTRKAVSTLKEVVVRVDELLYPEVIVPVTAFLPSMLAYGVALAHGDIRYRLLASPRKEIMFSLSFLFGSRLSPRQRERMTRDYFRMRSCEPVDGMRLLGHGRALMNLVKVTGEEHLRAALSKGKGAVLCSAHFGSHKSCFSIVGAKGFPVSVVARWSFNPDGRQTKLRKLFYRLREGRPVTAHTGPVIARRTGNYGVAVQAAKLLQRNELVGMMVDHEVYPGDASKPMKFGFLERQAVLVPGAVSVAKLTGAPVLVMISRRSDDWRHQELEIFPPVTLDGDTASAFGRCLTVVERAIATSPGQWQRLKIWDLVHMGILPREIALAKPWKRVGMS